MSLELNKISAAVLVAGLLAMGAGKIADSFYHPEEQPEKRGFEVVVADEGTGGSSSAEPAVIDISALIDSGDAAKGEAVTKKCVSCHTFEQGGADKVGPNLWGIIGRAKAGHGGFTYSDALKAKGGSWTEEDLFHFLQKPNGFVPGTKMAFAGFKKPIEEADLIAYLRTLK